MQGDHHFAVLLGPGLLDAVDGDALQLAGDRQPQAVVPAQTCCAA